MDTFEIRDIQEKDFSAIEPIIKEEWGSLRIVSKGKLYNASHLKGVVVESNNKIQGFLLYVISDLTCEVIALKSLIENMGIGSKLLSKAREIAESEGCNKLIVITTNDNIHAQEFYKKRGFTHVNTYINAVNDSRQLKPEIPFTNEQGIPITDELEFEITLTKK